MTKASATVLSGGCGRSATSERGPQLEVTPRIAILISSLRCGGAERLAVLLANGLSQRGYPVSIVTLAGAEPPFYPLSPAVRLRPLGLVRDSKSRLGAIAGNLSRVAVIHRALRRESPTVLVASMTETNVLAVLACRAPMRLPCRLALWEHNHPGAQRLLPYWKLGRRLLYRLSDAVVACGDAVGRWFTDHLQGCDTVIIRNAVVLDDRPSDPDAEELARQMSGERWVLSMGSLTAQKGFDNLLRAFARIPAAKRRGWKLGIIGEGERRVELETLATQLGLGDSARLLGRWSNPLPLLRAGDIFALSSRYEGLPLALMEAMACGLPVVAFDCPGGAADVLRDGTDGILVPPEDVAGLSAALERLIGEPALRKRLACAGRSVLRRFDKGLFLRQWERLITRLASRSSGAAAQQS